MKGKSINNACVSEIEKLVKKEEKASLVSSIPSTRVVVASFDGLCEPASAGGPRNPGGCACGGWWIEACPGQAGLEHPIAGGRFYLSGEGAPNNVAEYRAALDALRVIYATGYRGPVVLRGDSQLVCRQYTGEWSCNAEHLQGLLAQLRYAATFFESVVLKWVPREQNERADEQSRHAYHEARSKVTV